MKRYLIALLCLLLIISTTFVGCDFDQESSSRVSSSVKYSESSKESSSEIESSEESSTTVESSTTEEESSTTEEENSESSTTEEESSTTEEESSESSTTEEESSSEETTQKSEKIVISSTSTSVNVGEKITVTVAFNSLEDVKTFGLRPLFDEEYFELVSGKMLITGAISNFSDGIGVVAFDDCVDLDNQNVMQFVLKAKKASQAEAIGCDASIKGEGDKVIVVSQPVDIVVTIK